MKIEKVGESTLRVFLSMTELSLLDIDAQSFASGDARVKVLMLYIFSVIKDRTEFDPFISPLQVTAVGSDLGVKFTVSRLKKKKPRLTPEQKERYRNAKPVLKKTRYPYSTYYFNGISELSSALFTMSDVLLAESAVYKYDEGGYVLIARKSDELMQYHFHMTEFAYDAALMPSVECVTEHSKLIAEGETLVDFVNKMKIIE